MIPDSELKSMVTRPEQVHDEGMLRLGEKCIEDMTREYIKKHSSRDVESYKSYLRHNLTYEHWLHSIIDPEQVIACMDRVRNDKLRTDAEYRQICYEADNEMWF